MDRLAVDAGALVEATAGVTGEKVCEARRKLSMALGHAREMCGVVCDKTIENAREADRAVRRKPYQAIGIGFGFGMLVGYLFSRR